MALARAHLSNPLLSTLHQLRSVAVTQRITHSQHPIFFLTTPHPITLVANRVVRELHPPFPFYFVMAALPIPQVPPINQHGRPQFSMIDYQDDVTAGLITSIRNPQYSDLWTEQHMPRLAYRIVCGVTHFLRTHEWADMREYMEKMYYPGSSAVRHSNVIGQPLRSLFPVDPYSNEMVSDRVISTTLLTITLCARKRWPSPKMEGSRNIALPILIRALALVSMST